jgi:hypothetical protein
MKLLLLENIFDFTRNFVERMGSQRMEPCGAPGKFGTPAETCAAVL